MSTRHFRKVFGEPKLPPPDSDEEDFQPLYATQKSAFAFDDLGASDSNSENINNQSSDEDSTEKVIKVKQSNKNKKNKKKKAQNKKGKKQMADDGNKNEDSDEVERSVREVNQILGELPIVIPSTSETSNLTQQSHVMSINWRYLNSKYELKKKFDYDIEEDENEGNGRKHKKSRQPDILRFRRKATIVRMEEFIDSFKKGGLTMSVYERKGPLVYFAFDHDQEYRRRHQEFLRVMFYSHQVDVAPYLLRQYKNVNMHVEFWIEEANTLFTSEENAMAEGFLKRSIAYMQYVLHPSFVLDDPNVRLSYNILENQPFFHALLKYLHILTNTLCHKTALELAKLLLNLDPTDPMAMLLVIDILALRAREHKWLIEAIDKWNVERDAEYMPNLKYSYALAKYQVAKKSGEDLSEASRLLRSALILFPSWLLPLLRCTKRTIDPKILQHAFFTTFADSTAMLPHKKLADFYARYAYTRWDEQCVVNWVQETAVELINDYDENPEVQKEATHASSIRLAIHQQIPAEIQRHLYTIQPMKKLLYNNALEVVTPVMAPLIVPGVVNRYGYHLVRQTVQSSMMSHFYEFARSLLPHLNQQHLPPDVAALLRGERPPRREANNLQEIEARRPLPEADREPERQGHDNNQPANVGAENPRVVERAAIVEELEDLRRAQTIMSAIDAAMMAMLRIEPQAQQQEEAGNDPDDDDVDD